MKRGEGSVYCIGGHEGSSIAREPGFANFGSWWVVAFHFSLRILCLIYYWTCVYSQLLSLTLCSVINNVKCIIFVLGSCSLDRFWRKLLSPAPPPPTRSNLALVYYRAYAWFSITFNVFTVPCNSCIAFITVEVLYSYWLWPIIACFTVNTMDYV